MVRLKADVSDELPQPPNVADESNVGAIASAATQPLIAQAEAQHSEIAPDLTQILDQQHGPLPEDPNRWFESSGSMQAFTKYLQSHGIIRDTGCTKCSKPSGGSFRKSNKRTAATSS